MSHSGMRATTMSPAVAHISNHLRNRIGRGELRDGDRLPTERDLAEEYRVSRTTIRLALDALDREGVLVRASACRPVVRTRRSVEGASRLPGASGYVSAPISTDRRNIALWIAGEPNDVGAYSALQGVQLSLDPDRFRLIVASPRG